MHLMRSWALLQVTLLSGGLTILLVLDLDGTTGKTEEAGEKYPLYRWGKICLSRGAAFIIPISFIRSSRSQRCKPRSIHYGHSQGGRDSKKRDYIQFIIRREWIFRFCPPSIPHTKKHFILFFSFHFISLSRYQIISPIPYSLNSDSHPKTSYSS